MQNNNVKADPVTPIFEWINLEYDYPSEEARENAINSGEFIEGSPRISDVDVYYKDKNTQEVFVTSPRSVNGVPVTLGTVTKKTYNGNPVIAPYPSWDWHGNLTSCPENRIVSVFRIHIDDCSRPRLWIIDSGFTLLHKCPPQVLAFDLKTNQLIHRYEIPSAQLQSNSVLAGVITDVKNRNTCNDTFLYLADTRGFAIIVYNVNLKTSWRVSDKSMFAVPDYGVLCISGSQFELMDGLQSVALSPYVEGEDRVLFYHALASNTENWLWTSKLQNWTGVLNSSIFHLYCGRRSTQSSVMAIAKNGVAFFGLASPTSIDCWNTFNTYGNEFIYEVYKNETTLQHISGLKIITDPSGREELWFANTRASRIQNGPTNDKITNFRVQKALISDLLKHSKCNETYKPMAKDYLPGYCYADNLDCLKCFNSITGD
ncbi:hypothetical protein RN001_014042 [Aquatica leii]|uniref:Uncharacterized protein n=1 Tax=Aquatica leii TaxID=1421715 RepID=A0AAN7SCN9_9COLE|nr:hypothetical protein RN001_014042 [Aquatica leii]